MFNKRVDLLTFDDVVAFLTQGRREDVHLDYKREMTSGSKIAKLAGAFANTYGGFIVFGAKESDRAPVPPYEGAALGRDPVQAVQSACRQYLTPPVDPQFSAVLRNPSDASKAFLVVAIPQSGIAPHVFRESKGDEGYVYIKAQDHKEPVYPTLERYELLREQREACRARAEQIMARTQGELAKAWQRVWPAEIDSLGGRRFLQLPFIWVAVCRAYPERDVLVAPQSTVEMLRQYMVKVRYECFQWRPDDWGPLEMVLPAADLKQLDTFDCGALTNTVQQRPEIPLAAVMHSEGCFAGKVGVPLCVATPFHRWDTSDEPGPRRYVPASVLCGFGLGLIRSAFRWFQALGSYASMRVNVSVTSDRLSHWILRPNADRPAKPNTFGQCQQGPTTGYTVQEEDCYGPASASTRGEWVVPWPCDAEANRIAAELTTRYVSAFNVRGSSIAKEFVDAVAATVC
jgi:hypothetical protein